jgi:hypothetical protein
MVAGVEVVYTRASDADMWIAFEARAARQQVRALARFSPWVAWASCWTVA